MSRSAVLSPTIDRKKIFLFGFIILTLLVLILAGRLYYIYNGSTYNVSFAKVLLWASLEIYLWGFLGVGLFSVYGRIEFAKKTKITQVITNVLLTLLMPVVHLFCYAMLWYFSRDWFFSKVGSSYTSAIDVFLDVIFSKYFYELITFLVIITLYYLIEYYKRMRAEHTALNEMKAHLTDAKLTMLKAQLQPHFLFNTLNTITSLIHTEPNKADLMTTRLSDLLRASLDSTDKKVISFKEELAYIKAYLSIQEIRFGERLQIVYDIDESTLNWPTPPLLLQPLVENAVKHGIDNSTDGGTISIRARITGELLKIEIEDNGPGVDNNATADKATIGIRNCRERLAQLYTNEAQMLFENIEPHGLRISILIPGQSNG